MLAASSRRSTVKSSPWQQANWRASSNGTEIRLSILRDDGAVLKIRRRWLPERRVEIDLADVGETVDEFQAIGEDAARFAAFVNARAESSTSVVERMITPSASPAAKSSRFSLVLQVFARIVATLFVLTLWKSSPRSRSRNVPGGNRTHI